MSSINSRASIVSLSYEKDQFSGDGFEMFIGKSIPRANGMGEKSIG